MSPCHLLSRKAEAAPRSTRPLVRAPARDAVRDQRLHRHDDRLVYAAPARRQQSDLGDRLDGGRRGPGADRGAPHVPLPARQRAGRLRGRVRHAPYWTRSDWMLPFALAVTVLISSYVIRVKTMWRQAPITAAIVLAAGISAGREGRRHRERIAQGGAGDLRMHRGAGGELADVEGLARPAADGAGRTCRTARGGGEQPTD